MAIVFRSVPTATFVFVDDDNNEARVTVGLHGDVAAAPDLPTMQRAVRELGAAIAAVSDSALVGVSLNFAGYDDTFPTASAGSEVERKALFVLRDASGYLASVEVPSIDQAKLESDMMSVDLADTDVAALIDWLTEEQDMTLFSLLGHVNVTNTKGVDVVSVLEAYQVHRGSRKQRSRRG